MANLDDHLQAPDLSAWEPVAPNHAAPTLPRPVPPSTQPGPNPFLRTTLPAKFGLQPDSLRQFYNPATSQNRIVPLPLAADPAIAAIAKTVVQQQAAATSADSDPFLHFRGTWQSFTPYSINDVVIFDGSTYVGITASTGLRPDQNTSNWTLLSENLVFNPTIRLTSGPFALGFFDTSITTTGTSSTLSAGSLTPSATNELAIWFGSYSNGGAPPLSESISNITPAGWSQFGLPQGGTSGVAAIYQLRSNTSSFSPTASIGPSEPWVSVLTTWSFAGNLTATVTSVQVNGSNVCTVTCANTFTAGETVQLTGLTNATFLNNQHVKLTSATATQIVFAFTHASYGPTSDTGTASLFLALQAVNTSGAFSSIHSTLLSAVTAGNTILLVLTTGNGVTINSVSDSQGNSYQTFSAVNTVGLSVAYAQNVKAGTTMVNVGLSGLASGASFVAQEIQGSAFLSFYEPYDIVEFRGSMFVCLKETTSDAFTDPNSWALIGPGSGSVDILTASYSTVAADTGRLLSFNSSSATTLTLPNPIPAPPAGASETGWWIAVQNIGTGTLTIANNGLTIDGVAGSLTLGQNQGLVIFADSTGNYETLHGMTSIVLPNIFVNSGVNGSGQVTVTLANQNANLVWAGPASGAAAAPTFRALVNADLPATTPTVPPELTVAGNVASPAGSLAITKANEPANTVWAGPTSGSPAQPTFRSLAAGDIPSSALPPLAIASASGTASSTVSGVLRLPGNVIPPAGTYRVSVYMALTGNPSAGNLDVNVGWNDGTSARSATNGTLGAPADISTAALNVANGTIILESDGVHDVTWAMTLT